MNDFLHKQLTVWEYHEKTRFFLAQRILKEAIFNYFKELYSLTASYNFIYPSLINCNRLNRIFIIPFYR